ncbi:hypothetical protein [Ruegeria sp. YS9]|uniref:hypothetical protein n=1 Tax=Ruegeria sp. YS9 TaxID=2966453 RepID=UPI00214B30C4|nr:hypothetical protein [Ruegeria sp. YS9]UUV06907.1 hypothetical protein NOR97_03880 [Ruegeria sp. YS9]
MVILSRPEEFDDWLNSLSNTALKAFATRSALQVLPYAFVLSDQESSSREQAQFLLACFRANIVSGLVGAGLYPEIGSVTSSALATLDAANTENGYGTLTEPTLSNVATAVAATFYATRATSAEAIHDLNANAFTYGAEITQALSADAIALTATPDETAQVFATELWHGAVPEPYASLSQQFSENAPETPWEFWAEWYEGMLKGEPLDWELQRRIALIDESIWNSGVDAIAYEIEQIRTRWEVEKALSDIKDSLRVRTSARHGIGGNNPPERIEDERLSGAITLIWEATEELSTALEEERPARERIEAILAKFKSGLAGFLKWCAGKGDLAVDTLIKWGIPATGAGYAAKYPEKIEALIKAIEDWLPYLH